MCVGGEVDARGPPSLSILLFQVLFIFQIVCICRCEDMCPGVHCLQRSEAQDPYRAAISCSCEPSDVGAWNQTQVLWRVNIGS